MQQFSPGELHAIEKGLALRIKDIECRILKWRENGDLNKVAVNEEYLSDAKEALKKVNLII